MQCQSEASMWASPWSTRNVWQTWLCMFLAFILPKLLLVGNWMALPTSKSLTLITAPSEDLPNAWHMSRSSRRKRKHNACGFHVMRLQWLMKSGALQMRSNWSVWRPSVERRTDCGLQRNLLEFQWLYCLSNEHQISIILCFPLTSKHIMIWVVGYTVVQFI